MKPLILVGGGGHCKSVIEVAESAGREIIGILDVSDNLGNTVLGYPVVGTDNEIEEFADEVEFIVTVGHVQNCRLREEIHNKVIHCGGSFATIIASTAQVSKHAKIGYGTLVMHGAVVNAAVSIGNYCIINTQANIEHDTIIGDYCHVSTGAMVNGNCKIDSRTFIGSQSVILNGVQITGECLIGAASFVNKDITIKGVYAGIPAKLIDEN